jgi:hypothetical protein
MKSVYRSPGFAEPVIGPATSGQTRWLNPGYRLHASKGNELLFAAIDEAIARKPKGPRFHPRPLP